MIMLNNVYLVKILIDLIKYCNQCQVISHLHVMTYLFVLPNAKVGMVIDLIINQNLRPPQKLIKQ